MSCRSSSHSRIVVAVVIAVEVQGQLYSFFQVHDRFKKKKKKIQCVSRIYSAKNKRELHYTHKNSEHNQTGFQLV